MEQEQLLTGVADIPTQRRTGDGLFKRFVDNDGLIVQAAWLRACHGNEFVGTCRDCGGDLMPMRPIPGHGGSSKPDYPMECTNCTKEFVAACGRTIRWKDERGKKRRLPQGQVAIAKNAAVGQVRDED